jgi:hypothetical protein
MGKSIGCDVKFLEDAAQSIHDVAHMHQLVSYGEANLHVCDATQPTQERMSPCDQRGEV